MTNSTLSRWQKALYAAGTGAQNIFNMTLVTWSMFFYAPPAGQGQPLTPIVLFSVAMLSGRLVDALLDPLVGYWSDRVRWRWGRRLPFIVLGGLPLALSFLMIWLPPVPGYSLYNGIYFLLMVNVYFALTTLVFVPQGALLPEIAVSPAERLSLSTYNAMSAMITAAVVAIGTGPLAERIGFRGMGAAMAAVGLVLTYAPVLAIREHSQARPANPLRFADAVRLTLTNRPFMAYVIGMVFFYLGFNALMGDLPYFVTTVLHQDEGKVSLYLAIHLAAAVAFFPLVGPAAVRWGKKRVYTLAYLGLAVWFPLLVVVGRLPLALSPAWQAAIFMGVAGAILSFHYVLPGAMISQAIDHDAERTGLRREAMYFGIQGILQKAAMGLSGLLLAALLRWGGYEAAHPLGIYLVGPAAGLMFLGGYFSLARWNLPG